MSLRPAIEVLRRSSSPGMPLSAVSRGIVTSRSISSGLAPGFCEMISTSGGVGSGYASTFRLSAEWTPAPIRAMMPRMTIRRFLRLHEMIAWTMEGHSSLGEEPASSRGGERGDAGYDRCSGQGQIYQANRSGRRRLPDRVHFPAGRDLDAAGLRARSTVPDLGARPRGL